MKKFIVLTALVALGATHAGAQTEVRTTRGTEISESHVFFRLVKGVEISYSKTMVNGTEVLNLHFRNRTTTTQNFTWELVSPTRERFLSPAAINLAADGFHTSNGIFKIATGFDFNQYELVLTFN